jgi:hypothetical protein
LSKFDVLLIIIFSRFLSNLKTSLKLKYLKFSLFSISKQFLGVSIEDIKKWNDISGDNIQPGMKLKING